MDWQQKALAIMALTGWQNFSIKLRDNGSWYVQHTGVERKEGHCLGGGCQNGKTPEEAINQCWEWITDPNYYMVIGAFSNDRQAKRWNGFMWADVVEDL